MEAIANAVPSFRQPRARRAQHTEMWLGILLGIMLIGIALLIRKFHVPPSATQTTLAQLAAAAVGHNAVFYGIQLITTVLLALAANTSFGGLPVLAALAVELISKFTEGAWLVVLVVPLLVLMFTRIKAAYDRIGALLELGRTPAAPERMNSLVVVPVAGISRLTREAISAALSLGDEVVAVTVCFADPEDERVDASFRDQWTAWHPDVPLTTLRTAHRSLAPPVVAYLRKKEHDERFHRVVVLIPEVQPARPWQWILHNQRGAVLARAIRRDTANVVICRLRFQSENLAPDEQPRPAT